MTARMNAASNAPPAGAVSAARHAAARCVCCSSLRRCGGATAAPSYTRPLPQSTLTLLSSEDENYNTKKFIFTAEPPVVPPSAGSTYAIGCTGPFGPGGNKHTRWYTPVGLKGASVELLVKVYTEGLMSKHIHGLKP